MKNFISEGSLVHRTLEFRAGFVVGILLLVSLVLSPLNSSIEYFAIGLVSLIFLQSLYYLNRALILPEYLARPKVIGFLFYCVGIISGIIASIAFTLMLLLCIIIVVIIVALFLFVSYYALDSMYCYL